MAVVSMAQGGGGRGQVKTQEPEGGGGRNDKSTKQKSDLRSIQKFRTVQCSVHVCHFWGFPSADYSDMNSYVYTEVHTFKYGISGGIECYFLLF